MAKEKFFAREEPEAMTEKLLSFISTWGTGEGSQTSGSLGVVLRNGARNRLAYESMMHSSRSFDQALEFVGEQDELIRMKVPLARTRIRQFVSFMAKKKLNFEAVTDVSDSDPLQTARLAKSICDTVVKKQRLQEKSETIAEKMLVEGMCFASCLWRDDKGLILTGPLEEGEALAYEGDVSIDIHNLSDVFFDWTASSWDEVSWCCLRVPMQRYDLIAQFPEMEKEILSLPAWFDSKETNTWATRDAYRASLDPLLREGKVAVYHFFYKPTSAMPYGRYTIFGEGAKVFYDSPEVNVYQGLPVTPFFVDQVEGTCLGYPLFSNLLPSQELLDATFSSIATNTQSFSTPIIMVPKGSDISVSDLQSMNLVQYSPMSVEGGGKPENLQLSKTPPELFNLIGILSNQITDASMINDTLRGNPDANVTSGVMAATLSANALEFVNVASQRLYLGLEFLMNQAIGLYKIFASVERLVEISGKSNASYVRTFKGEDLATLKQIRIQETNPLLSTTAGRLSISDGLLQIMQQNRPDLVQKYLMILEGAPASELYETEVSEQTAVQQEIDALLEGQEVLPIITDNHPLYIQGYKKLLYNPVVRSQSDLLPIVLNLIEKRLELERQLDPMLKAILRNQPLPEPQAPPAPPGAGGEMGDVIAPEPPVAQPTAEPARPAEPGF